MESAARLARSLPNLQFVLLHAGMLEDTSAKGLAEWRAGMDALAACPNVAVKLSGLGTFVRRIDAEYIALVAGETVRRFGAERCLFGSNFPIEKLWTDYGTLLGAYQMALAKILRCRARADISRKRRGGFTGSNDRLRVIALRPRAPCRETPSTRTRCSRG